MVRDEPAKNEPDNQGEDRAGRMRLQGEVKSLTDGRVKEGAQRDGDRHGNQRQYHEQAYTETHRRT